MSLHEESQVRETTLPPGPNWPPMFQLLNWVVRPTGLMRDCARRYGDAFTLQWPGSGRYVFFSSPTAIREIFTGAPEDLYAGEGNFILEGMLGSQSVLLMDGARHLRERRLLLPPFHGDRMREYGEVMRSLIDRAIDRWPVGQPFAMQDEMQNVTLDVILRTVFGLEEGARMEELQRLLRQLLGPGSHPLLLIAAYLLRGPRLARLLSFGVEPISILGFKIDISSIIPWTHLSRTRRRVDEVLFAEIARRREPGAEHGDILSMLIEARDEDGQPLSDIHLRDEMMTLLLAGHETTATSLAWVVHNVLRHPQVLHRLVGEIRGAAGRLDQMEYLDAVIKESARIIPILPVVARRLQKPLRIGGFDLPKGVVVAPCIYLAHQRTETWGDPEVFRPERFLGKRLDPYEYFPFGGGVRRCLGQAFAGYEMKIVLAQIFSRVNMHLAPGEAQSRVVRRGITLTPSRGVRVVAERV